MAEDRHRTDASADERSRGLAAGRRLRHGRTTRVHWASFGASPTNCDRWEHTPADDAEREGRPDVVELLAS